jgi:two-component system phosphate regulon response regulator OmpR
MARRVPAAHRVPRGHRVAPAGVEPSPAPFCLSARGGPRVLHIDRSKSSALMLATLLMPSARVDHVQTLAQARHLLAHECFSLVVIDPQLGDGNAAELLPLLFATPLLVYSMDYPDWIEGSAAFLPKRLTPPGQLWTVMARMMGIDARVPLSSAN